jgi:hypothetical protein
VTEPEPTPPSFVPYVAGPVAPGGEPLQDVRAAMPPSSTSTASRSRPLLLAASGLVAGLILGAGATYAAVAGNAGNSTPAAAAAPATSTVYVTVTVAAPTTATTTTAAPATTSPAPPPPPPTPTIQEGTWTVGEDFPPGTYKTSNAPESCYWGIYKSGQNQDLNSIISNHNGGGNLRVTLKAGQDFTTERCGTWTKVG